MEYTGLQLITNAIDPHLGGNVLEGDPFTFAPRCWRYMIERFSLESVLDLGSGIGYSSAFFYKNGLKVIAVDGLQENVDLAVYPTILQDLANGPVNCKVDLVHCQEVVEHIHPDHLENLLASLSCGRIILMTNALPGQYGYNHINEREISYWIDHLQRYNCHLLSEDTLRLRNIARDEGAVYLANTGCIYANRNRLA